MGAVDTPQRQPKAKKGGGLKRPKRRIGIRIDMTPMVDIAFLLLIFYMVTTVFSMPQSMEVNLPPKPKEGEPPPIPVAVSRILELWVDEDGNMFWLHKTDPQEDKLPEFIQTKDLRELLMKKNQEIPKLVTILRIDPKARYEMMVHIIDEIQLIERLFKQADPSWSYRFSLQDMTQWEHDLIQEAKAKMGMVTASSGGAS